MHSHVVNFEADIKPSSKVVIAVSKENTDKNGPQSGEKLFAQLNALREKKCDITVVIADDLQRYNFEGDHSSRRAREWGDSFIADHKHILSDCRVLHWNDFRESLKSLKKCEEIIEAEYKKEGHFQKAIVRTFYHTKAGSRLNGDDLTRALENSINYQKEEYAVILAMGEAYDALIYPKRTDGMAHLFGPTQFQESKETLPRRIKFNVVDVSPCTPRSASFLTELAKREDQNNQLNKFCLSIIHQIARTLWLSQYSDADKVIFTRNIANLLKEKTTDNNLSTQMDTVLHHLPTKIDASKQSDHTRQLAQLLGTLLHTELGDNPIFIETLARLLMTRIENKLNFFSDNARCKASNQTFSSPAEKMVSIKAY